MSENIIRLIPEENYTLIPVPHMIQNLRSLLDDHAITYDIHVFDPVRYALLQSGNRS